MGVYGLTALLLRHAPKSVRTIKPSTLAHQTIAFDASCHLNKFMFGDEPHPHRHIYGFYMLAKFCELNNITPIFVFDGPYRLAAKKYEHERRERGRRKVSYSLLYEKERSARLESWLEVSKENCLQLSDQAATRILNQLGETLEQLEYAKQDDLVKSSDLQNNELFEKEEQDIASGMASLKVSDTEQSTTLQNAILSMSINTEDKKQAKRHKHSLIATQVQSSKNSFEAVEDDQGTSASITRRYAKLAELQGQEEEVKHEACVAADVSSTTERPTTNAGKAETWKPVSAQNLDKEGPVQDTTTTATEKLGIEFERSAGIPMGGQTKHDLVSSEYFAVEDQYTVAEDALEAMEAIQKKDKYIVERQSMLEAKLMNIAQDLRRALDSVQDKEKYTKTVQALSTRERDTMTRMIRDQVQSVKKALNQLRSENNQMLASLEKRSIRITQQLRDECKDFLEALGYVCFSCDHHEAEAMCAHLAKSGKTSATVSEDMDTLVFGDAPMLRYFFSRARPILTIDPRIAREELGLTRDAFVDLCILCGTDFSATIRGVGPNRAFEMIKRYGSIEAVLNNMPSRYVPEDNFDPELARMVFNSLPPIPNKDSIYQRRIVDEDRVRHLFERFQIDPEEVDLRVRTIVLQQNFGASAVGWGQDPFATEGTIFKLY